MSRLLLAFTIAGCSIPLNAQSHLNGGIGFIAGSNSDAGLVLEIEYEKMYTDNFSLPLRLDLGIISLRDYHSLVVDLHKGFRKYFKSGFFAEQDLGIGVLSMSNKTDDAWYYDTYGNVLRYGDTPAWGLIPSVSLGGGYNLTKKKGTRNMIWIRPKIYWNLAFTGLDTPYAQVQFGFTKTFK